MDQAYHYIHSFYFSITLFSTIVFFDVLVKFKNSFVLRSLLLLLTFSIAMTSLIYSQQLKQFVFLIALFRATASLSILNLFSYLYFPRYVKWVAGLTIAIVSFAIFWSLVNVGMLGSGSILDAFKAKVVDDNLNLKVNDFVKIIRFIFLFFICCTMFYFWYVIFTKKGFNNIYYQKIKSWTNWLVALSIIALVGNILIQKTININKYFWGDVLTIFMYYYFLLLLLFRPRFLNKSALKIALGRKFNVENEKEITSFILESIMESQQYFKNRDASLEGLADLISVSPTNLSFYIYKNYSMSFNDFVNKYRVNYFFEIVKDPAFKNYTIDALAKEAGFSSRQHLNKPFKKFHGGKPSDLLDF